MGRLSTHTRREVLGASIGALVGIAATFIFFADDLWPMPALAMLGATVFGLLFRGNIGWMLRGAVAGGFIAMILWSTPKSNPAPVGMLMGAMLGIAFDILRDLNSRPESQLTKAEDPPNLAADFDPLQALGFTLQFLATRRARYIAEDTHFELADIRCGVMFFMAFWSSPAREAFSRLKNVLAEIDPDGNVELIVIDVDGCTQLKKLPELDTISIGGGYGEAAWVKNGRIVTTTGHGYHPEFFAANTRLLLHVE